MNMNCRIENDGCVCLVHRIELLVCPVVPIVGENPRGFGHIEALVCPVSGQAFLHVEGM
jgi:hypothetical protein